MLKFLIICTMLALTGCGTPQQQAKINTAITNISTSLHDQCGPLQDLIAAASLIPQTPRVAYAVTSAQGAITTYCSGPVSHNLAGAVLAIGRVTVGLIAVLPARTASLIMRKHERHRARL